MKTPEHSDRAISSCMGRLFCVVLGLCLLTGCASKRPILYPNTHYKAVGKEVANYDIEECLQLASRSGVGNNQAGKITQQTAGGAAVGAAAAGAWGLVRGDAGSRAAAGAAAGGATGLVGGALRSGEPDPIYRNFVQRCLRERGYDVIGWQ
jgi:outer membrane lipoprotein SlyB